MPSGRTTRFGDAVIRLSLLTGDVEKQLKKVESRMKNFGKAMSSLGSGGLKISGAITGLLAFPVKMAADLEKTRAEFSALIGDAGKASKLLSDIEGLSLITPLGSADLSAAARTLMGFGVTLEDIMPRLRQLGEVSGGNSDRLGRLALAFGQMSGKGRLMGQELNQMIEQGFNPLQEISKKTGESIGELQARMESGGISAEEIGNAFESVTGKGGRFNGLMKSISNTTIGKFNELKESIIVAIRPIGDALLPMLNDYMMRIKSIIPALSNWIKNNGETIRGLAKLAVTLAAVSIAIVGVGTVVTNLGASVGALRIAIAAAGAHPILAAIAAVATGAYALKKAFDAAHDSVERTGKAIRQLRHNNMVGAGTGGGGRLKNSLEERDWMITNSEAWKEGQRKIAEAANEAAKRTPVPFVGTPATDPMMATMAGFGLTKHEMNNAAPSDGGAIQQALSDAWTRAAAEIQQKKIELQIQFAEPLSALEKVRNWMQEKVEEGQAAMEGRFGPEMLSRQQATFDARFAKQIFGGGTDPNTKLLQQQLAELKAIRKQDNAVAVV